METLHIEMATANVPNGKQQGVEFTENGAVCYHPAPGTGDDGVFCMVDSLPEGLKERLERGHRMAMEAHSLMVGTMKEAQAMGYGPNDAWPGSR